MFKKFLGVIIGAFVIIGTLFIIGDINLIPRLSEIVFTSTLINNGINSIAAFFANIHIELTEFVFIIIYLVLEFGLITSLISNKLFEKANIAGKILFCLPAIYLMFDFILIMYLLIWN